MIPRTIRSELSALRVVTIERAGGSEPLVHDERGFFIMSEGIPCVQGMGKNHHDKDMR